jgi:predicted transcriptional regulator
MVYNNDYMKQLLAITLPTDMAHYKELYTIGQKTLQQSENILIACDLITYPWDDVFLRQNIRNLTQELFQGVYLLVRYQHEFISSINDIHGGTALAISFNPLKHASRAEQVATGVYTTSTALMSFITIAHQLRFLSPMNMNVLQTEIKNMDEYIMSFVKQLKITSMTHMQYLSSIGQNTTTTTSENLQTLQNIETHKHTTYDVAGIADVFTRQSSPYKRHNEFVTDMSDISVNDIMSHTINQSESSHSVATKKPETKTSTTPLTEVSLERKKSIVNMVRGKGRVSIHDIAGYFPDVTHKTIQRDLSELITEGKISRIGDKRWALYTV